jgi:AraC family transcriptional activator FtrA
MWSVQVAGSCVVTAPGATRDVYVADRPGDAPAQVVGHPNRHRVAIVVLERTLVLDLAVAVQSFGRKPSAFARIRDEARSPYDVVVCGRAPTRRETLGFTVDALADDQSIVTADTVVVTGVDEPQRPHDPDVLAAIAEAGRNGARLVWLCAGVFVLGQAGVIDGHRVTTHWSLADDLRSHFPAADVREDALYIDDGQVLTSGGMLAGADLCLHILRSDFGQAYANDVARLLISPPHRGGNQLQYVTGTRARPGGSLSEVLTWMLDHLADDLTIDSVAARAHMSRRTLARRFQTELGTSLSGWVTERRIERARSLLEHSASSITEIAYASGFGSLASFRRQFIAHTGAGPREYRAMFGRRASARAAQGSE